MHVALVALRPKLVLGAAAVAVVVAACGGASWPANLADPVGDVEHGPDLASVRVSNTDSEVTFAVRFATERPLRVDEAEGWVDMLLIGIDVPPLGPEPVAPGGEWRGADFAFGAHGPSTDGMLVRLGRRQATRLGIRTSGSTLTLSVPRRALGDPDWFTFSVAAARESNDEAGDGGGIDVAPDQGTLRYTLAG